jgi:hypothetical protein
MSSLSSQRTFLSLMAEETTITASDFPLILCSAVGYLVYRLLLTKYLLTPLSAFVKHQDKEKQRRERYRFVHRGFDLIHYATAATVGALCACFLPYGRCPFYFRGCEVYSFQTKPCFVCSRLEKVYYCLFVSYYLSDVPFVGTVTDTRLQLFHHLVALSLEVLAVLSGRPVITLSCNLLHDSVDIFLYLGKILNYLRFKFVADLVLLTFAGSYLWFRLINFGMVIYAFWFLDVGPQEGHVRAYQACKVLVFGLLFCHIIWFSQVAKAFVNTVTSGRKEIRDTRSDEGAKEKGE